MTARKQSYWSLVCYIAFLLLFVGAVGYYTHLGSTLDIAPEASGAGSSDSAFATFRMSVEHHLTSSIGLLLLQILVILMAVRLVGWVFKKIGQPAVIGEICAGIMLGPSLLGRFAPEVFDSLFPASSLGNIQLLSNFGLILFMFVIGMELRLSDIRRRFVSSTVISHVGIFFPFVLSLPLSYYIYQEYAAGQTTFLAFSLFVGIAMSITAFPVLARIIQEQGLQRKPLGKLALSTAASSDITAWMMLAGIIAISQSGSLASIGYNVLFFALYLLVMFGVIRPLFRVAGKVYTNTEVISHTLVGVIFILLLLSSWITELLSMHALFGAFLLGLVMPEDLSFRKIITDKVEDVSLMLFLPLFFVSSGLQTEMALIDGTEMWMLLGLFTLVAVLGKVGGTYISARATGLRPLDSLYLGAFMNTRGLMELVVLAIGLEMGILSPRLYVVLVLMTVITTVMTMPMIQLINRIKALYERRQEARQVRTDDGYKALLSFGRPASGITLMHLGDQLLRRGAKRPQLTAVHITTDMDISTIDADTYYSDNFDPLLRTAEACGYNVETEHIISDQVETAIIDKLRKGRYTMLIVGAGLRLGSSGADHEASTMRASLTNRVGGLSLSATESLLSINTLLRDKMAYFTQHAPCSVGILLNRGYTPPQHILLKLSSENDLRLLCYARTLAENNGARLDIILAPEASITREQCPTLLSTETFVSAEELAGQSLAERYGLIVLSYDEWQRASERIFLREGGIPSCLIMNLKTPIR